MVRSELEGSQELSIERTYDQEYLIYLLRNAPLKDNPVRGFLPYRAGKFSIVTLDPAELFPTALYVLKSGLDKAKKLRQLFLQKGIDTLNLTPEQAVIDFTYGGKQHCRISPPLVEISPDDGGKRVITDGLHRAKTAVVSGEKISVMQVEGSSMPTPAKAVGWDEIKVCDAVPPLDQKRKFRFPNWPEIINWQTDNYPRFITGFNLPTHWKNESSPRLPASAAAIVTTHDDRVLLVKRRKDGLWGLPAGGAEADDFRIDNFLGVTGLEKTMGRELMQETGLVPMGWSQLGTINRPNGKTGTVFLANVGVGLIDLDRYVVNFNSKGGSPEVTELGLFTLGQIDDMQNLIFKPEYNLASIKILKEVIETDAELDYVDALVPDPDLGSLHTYTPL
jgi:8-oxo-dGTP pyrophosphatase MutT (NUDIX family)